MSTTIPIGDILTDIGTIAGAGATLSGAGASTVVAIMAGTELVAVLAPLALSLAMKIKALVEKDPAMTVNIQAISQDVLSVDQATIDEIEAWQKSVGLS